MRTIKFRGKGIKSGQWFYGSVVTFGNKAYIFKMLRLLRMEHAEVVPGTVGQFTGLCDENGKKIFEGDVIKCGMGLYVCEFIEGGFEFRDLSDSKLILKAIVNDSCIIGNIHDNPELLEKGGEQ